MSELRDLRAQLEEAAGAHTQEVKRLHEQARDLGRQREACLREVSQQLSG
jgi:rootletin